MPDVSGNASVTVFPDGSSFIVVSAGGRFRSGYKRPVSPARSHSSGSRSRLNSIKRTVSAVFNLCRANVWDWFITLTFSPDVVDRYSYADCSAFVLRFTRQLHYCGCSWLIVPEGHEDGAVHFHGLVRGDLPVVFSGHYDKVGRKVFNVSCFDAGFTTATRLSDPHAASRYISKYLEKSSDNFIVPKGKRRYWISSDLVRPSSIIVDLCTADLVRIASECVFSKEICNDFGVYHFFEMPSG